MKYISVFVGTPTTGLISILYDPPDAIAFELCVFVRVCTNMFCPTFAQFEPMVSKTNKVMFYMINLMCFSSFFEKMSHPQKLEMFFLSSVLNGVLVLSNVRTCINLNENMCTSC